MFTPENNPRTTVLLLSIGGGEYLSRIIPALAIVVQDRLGSETLSQLAFLNQSLRWNWHMKKRMQRIIPHLHLHPIPSVLDALKCLNWESVCSLSQQKRLRLVANSCVCVFARARARALVQLLDLFTLKHWRIFASGAFSTHFCLPRTYKFTWKVSLRLLFPFSFSIRSDPHLFNR